MREIVVSLREPSEKGRLYYARDPEIERDIVFIDNPLPRPRVHRVNIASCALIGFDSERILRDVEIMYNWRVWRIHPYLAMPQVTQDADLVLVDVESEPAWPPYTKTGCDEVVRHYYYVESDVSATTNTDYSCVQFLFGKTGPVGEWIALSHQCFALVADNYLRGFFVQLANAPLRQYKTRQTRRAVR